MGWRLNLFSITRVNNSEITCYRLSFALGNSQIVYRVPVVGLYVFRTRSTGNQLFFPIELHLSIVIPLLALVKSSFLGMNGLPNFVLIQRPGLAQQKEKHNITVNSSFWDFLEAECSNHSFGRYQKLKLCHLTTSSFGSSKHKEKYLFL